jgi:hypothetical protein
MNTFKDAKVIKNKKKNRRKKIFKLILIIT